MSKSQKYEKQKKGEFYNMYEKIDKLLKENNITPYRMCKVLGIKTSSMTAWKQGKYKPSVDNLKKIDDFFGTTIDYFL